LDHIEPWHDVPVGYVVFGAGAIGGLVGGRLFEAGLDVTLIARGEHLEVLQARGLTIESPAGQVTLPVPAVGHPSQVDWTAGHTVLLAMKSQQTAAALSDLVGVAPSDTPIACLQNGMANEPTVLRFFSEVYGVCVMCPAGHLEPGVVQAWSSPISGMLDIGRTPDGIDPTSKAIADDFESATFNSKPVEDVFRWKRRKLLTNLANAVEAMCGPGERSGALVKELVTEGEATLAAAGLDTASRDEDRARRGDLLQLGEIAGRRRPGGSSWQSVERGTGNIETDYLNGEIVLVGRMCGVPTPANQLIQEMTREFVAARRPPGTIPAASILEQLDRVCTPPS
jgi:2-dehydropantoate 2-reductase